MLNSINYANMVKKLQGLRQYLKCNQSVSVSFTLKCPAKSFITLKAKSN